MITTIPFNEYFETKKDIIKFNKEESYTCTFCQEYKVLQIIALIPDFVVSTYKNHPYRKPKYKEFCSENCFNLWILAYYV